MMSRMCLENYHWQKDFSENKFWLNNNVYVNVQHQFDSNSYHHKNLHFWPMVDGQLTVTVDIIYYKFLKILLFTKSQKL